MSDDDFDSSTEEDDFGDMGDVDTPVQDNEDLADDVLAEFDEEDFDEDFDDDFEEEVEGEYELEDDKYGQEFHEEFGHLEQNISDDDEEIDLDEVVD